MVGYLGYKADKQEAEILLQISTHTYEAMTNISASYLNCDSINLTGLNAQVWDDSILDTILK